MAVEPLPRARQWQGASLSSRGDSLSFIAVWSHPLLDWLNAYSVRLLMPFEHR